MRALERLIFRVPAPLRILVVGGVLSLLAATAFHQWQRQATTKRLDDEAGALEEKIDARIGAYVTVLRGVAGLSATDTWVGRNRFRRYISQLGLEQNYPGVQGVGISLQVSPARLTAFVAAARAEGWADYRVWPAGPRPEYEAILYLEPEDARNRAAIGYDMHTEAVRGAAMDQARDSGRPVASGRVTLVQEIDPAKQAGFLIYFPFYRGGLRPATVAGRRRLLAGFAYAAFRAGDFLQAVLGSLRLNGFTVSLYDGALPAADSLLFHNGGDPGTRGWVSRTWTVPVVGRPWTVVCSGRVTGTPSPWTVGIAGLLFSAAAGLVAARLERDSARAERSEAARRVREAEIALLVNTVPALVAYIDAEGVYRLCNQGYAALFHRDPGALIGRTVAEVMGRELFARIEPHLQQALGGRSVVFERWYRTPGVAARYLSSVFAPHGDGHGGVLGVYVLTSDLTTRQRAEESARFVADCGRLLIESMDAEATTRGVVNLAVPRVADVAVLFRIRDEALHLAAVAHIDRHAQQVLTRFLSRRPLPLSAQHNIARAARSGAVIVSAELNEADLARVAGGAAERRMLRILQLRSALHVPVVVRGRMWGVYSLGMVNASGRQFAEQDRHVAEEISTRVRLAVENALLFQEARQEVEERRRAEQVARETEEQLSLLVDAVRDYAIIGLDAVGRVRWWNEGASRILGYADPEALGLAAAQFYPAEDAAAGVPAARLGQAREHGGTSDERWLVRKDGTRFWAACEIAVLRDDDGAVRGYAAVMRDLTERKRMEEELEQRVRLRTTELAEAVQELEAFSYSVSHDLRAPLRTIHGFTELVLEEGGERLNGRDRDCLERVARASARLDRLITDLLAYTRVSKTKIELRRIDPGMLIRDLCRDHSQFQSPHADVRVDGELLPLLGNEAYLTQCVTNLLGNAVKFVPPGRHPEVHIATERRDGRVRLLIRDNGIGIPIERQARAFEMFERLHPEGKFEGTGVGLAIVRRAVQRMGGEVGLSSEPGCGTTFWIDLAAAD